MHFHLRPGGVTTVIRDQYAALRRRCECIVLTGEQPPGCLDPDLSASVRVVPGIGYTADDGEAPDARSTAAAIRRAMLEQWGAPADLLHVHNPTLRKNPSLLDTLRLTQESGIPLLSQVHDLAEDGRPSAFFPMHIDYPRDCHYGVINSRDRDALISAGLRPEAVHLMWNLVTPIHSTASVAPPARRRRRTGNPLSLIYPVRGIRRKNLGEAILLAAVLQGRLTLTLPPRDASDLARHSAWRDFASSLDLAVRFDAGLDDELGRLMAAADASLSTSLNEGFGFAFLEPWLAGLPVGGRRIPHVCRDFENAGVLLPWMYPAIPTPVSLLDLTSFSLRWKEAVTASYRCFGRGLGDAARQDAWEAMTGGGTIDFGTLDERAQQEVITRVVADRTARKALQSSQVERLRDLAHPETSIIRGNMDAILDSYGVERYSRMLEAVHQAAHGIPVRHRVDRQSLLDYFLDPRRFRILEQR